MGVYGDLLKLDKTLTSSFSTARPIQPKVEKPLPATQPTGDHPPIEPVKVIDEPSNADTVTPRHHGIKPPRYHDTVIPLIRAAVKQFGKEAATHRFTPDEKQKVAEMVFAYRNQNIRTSENEIARIGVNYLVEDYKLRGDKSILDQVLKALNE